MSHALTSLLGNKNFIKNSAVLVDAIVYISQNCSGVAVYEALNTLDDVLNNESFTTDKRLAPALVNIAANNSEYAVGSRYSWVNKIL